ncbi:hypothetical protein ACHAWC_002350, partial [Mediolabrus comicus]
MNLTVKTLKGGKFTIEIDPTQTIAQTKSIIENTKSELGSASSMKLIHSGKVLKDDDTIESCNIKPSDFLVVMITKAKKEKTPAPAAESKVESAPAASATETTAAATSSTETTTAAPPAAAAAATTSTTESTENNNSTNNNDEFPAEIMANLRALGFPESDILVCLRASNGNPDVAVEFLMNGIPPGIAAAAAAGGAGGGGANSGAAGGGGPLEALRQHPQFNDIRRLVQTNPQMLSAVLQQ